MTHTENINGGKYLVQSLVAHGVDTIFGVAGESYLPALDALYDEKDRINFITNRHEGGAAFMAEAYGKLTGKTGICFVTRGPGACNAAIGLHTARQDSSPMILLVGQVDHGFMGREAFQEIDYRQMFKPPIAKAVFQIDHSDDIGAVMAEAFRITQSGRKGPVVVSLPEDVLSAELYQSEAPVTPPIIKTDISREMKNFDKKLSDAQKPICIIGGSSWDDSALKTFLKFAEEHYLPVATAFRRQDLFDHNSRCYIGELGSGSNPDLIRTIRDEADLIILLNTRLGEIPSQGYQLINPSQPRQKIIHIYPDIDEHGRVYSADIGMLSKPNNFVDHLKHLDGDYKYQSWCKNLRQSYLKWSKPDTSQNQFNPDITGIYAAIKSTSPKDAIITTDAGNFSGWAQRYLKYGRPGRLLAPTNGAMGYGLPAAIAASIHQPEKTVIGLCGDGGFMMTVQELVTAKTYNATPVIVVFNNGLYGTIKMHQARDYPNRPIATELKNPDFIKLAKSCGADAVRITDTPDFQPAFQQAIQSKKLTVIEIKADPNQISASNTLADFEG